MLRRRSESGSRRTSEIGIATIMRWERKREVAGVHNAGFTKNFAFVWERSEADL